MSSMIRKTINGKDFEFGVAPMEQRLSMLTRLAKLGIAPIVGFVKKQNIDDAADVKLDELKVSSETIATAFENLAERMDEKIVPALLKDLCSTAFINGRLVNFETDFNEDLTMLFKVAYHSAEVQFGDFLEGIIGQLGIKKVPVTTQEKQK